MKYPVLLSGEDAELPLERLSRDETKVLLCPYCNGHYLHHLALEWYSRSGGEDSETGIHILTSEHAGLLLDGNMTENPSTRRGGFRVGFYCELCGARFSLEFAQHKGQTLITAMRQDENGSQVTT
jgi:hypothetical protein